MVGGSPWYTLVQSWVFPTGGPLLPAGNWDIYVVGQRAFYPPTGRSGTIITDFVLLYMPRNFYSNRIFLQVFSVIGIKPLPSVVTLMLRTLDRTFASMLVQAQRQVIEAFARSVDGPWIPLGR